MQYLTLDGGGIRALLSLQVLKYVEQRTGRQCRELFDAIYGVSTGGIIAIALAQGRSAASIEQLYLLNAERIFPSRACAFVRNLADPKYSASGIEDVLKRELVSMDEWPCAFVTAYDTQAQTLRVLGRDYGPAWLRARATSAAPTYFPPVRFGAACLVDGGIIANDPTLVAAAHAGAHEGGYFSVGTGSRPISVSYEECRDWGTLQWAGPLIDAMLTGSQGGAEYCASRLLSGYTRVDCTLRAGEERMDATDTRTLRLLQQRGREMVQANLPAIEAHLDTLGGAL